MNAVICHEGKVKISLGLMHEEFVPIFIQWINRHTDVEGTNLRPPYTLSSGIEWVRGFDKSKGKDEVFAIVHNDPVIKRLADQYIGHVGIHNIQWPAGIGTAGIVIGNQGNQGNGYGTEAMLLLLYHSFIILGLHKVIGSVKAFNAPSMGHLLKCGYQFIGVRKEHYFHKGRYVDEYLFEIFRYNWEPIWNYYLDTENLPKLIEEQRSLIVKLTRS